jgi:bifunctional isochorismate lyase/aryl carrier protein
MHKEEYFTPDNIAATAAAMAHALPINRRAAVFSLADSALLVIDMQRYFLCAGSHAFLPAAPAIIPNINRLIAVFKKAIRPVYFTRHANSMRDAGQMAVWWGELLGRDHPLGGIQNTVHTRKDPIIEKTQYDAFFNTDLESRLQQSNTRQLVITGVTTHLCCDSTARSAFMRGFAVFIAIDGTATWNRELHYTSLTSLAHGCATPLLTSDLIAAAMGHSQ